MIKSEAMGLLPLKVDVDYDGQPYDTEWKWAAVGQGKHGLLTYNYTPAVGAPGDENYAPASHNCVLSSSRGETLNHVQHKGMSYKPGPNGQRKLGFFVPWNSNMHDLTPYFNNGVLIRFPYNYCYGAEVNYRWGDVQMFRAQWKTDYADPTRNYVGTQFDTEYKLEWLPYDMGGFSPYAGVWQEVGGARANILDGFSETRLEAETVWTWSPRPGDIYYIMSVNSWQHYQNETIGYNYLNQFMHPNIPSSDIGGRKFQFGYVYVQQGKVMGSSVVTLDTELPDSEPGFIFNGFKRTGVSYTPQASFFRTSYEKGLPVGMGSLTYNSQVAWKDVIRFRLLSAAIDGSRAIIGFFMDHTTGTRIFTTQLDKKAVGVEDMPYRLAAAMEFKVKEKVADGQVQKGELDFDFEVLYTPRPSSFEEHVYEFPDAPLGGQPRTFVVRNFERSGARKKNDSSWCNFEPAWEHKYDDVDYSRAPAVHFREILDISYGQEEENMYTKYAFFASYSAAGTKHAKDQTGTVKYGVEVRLDGDGEQDADEASDIVFESYSNVQASPRCGYQFNYYLRNAPDAEPGSFGGTNFDGWRTVGLMHSRGLAMDAVFAYRLKSEATDSTSYPRDSTFKTDFYRISNTVFAVFEDKTVGNQVECVYKCYLYDGTLLETKTLSTATNDVTIEHTYPFDDYADRADWKYPYIKKWWGSWNPYTKEWSGLSSKPVCWV